ncbi:proton-coupled amino acid transporter-like protein pathetic isoform X2 [Leptinotarsa decemlineata]|nr:proton-coupled amino acid transporter-like protein pathetic isoform X2 [Leptinotarsa decemlineata]XP_023022901.1 proton-coupled amino acid transporter-like protein pathetic isoform X2 [Leptinotarsa decemlineata]XP_023022902.1 proton-coupled amino acid transporter-like protein pathetic isoform X2 [Leptinotarsa decemlineata]XP_023022903.1 proton-coupled amino acid transporter-like protein pathetic isoform X2 [Leptinotarsa decemlineata]XP_023022904.1 proton-coupled amino acid transporter-like p
MTKKKHTFPSTDDFKSTTTLANNDQISTKLSMESTISLDKVYNPYEHRILQHPNTFSGALIHILKGSLGSGLLAIPRAFMNAGLLVGIFGTIFIGFICTHTVQLLVSASQKVCKETKTPSLGFAETAQVVFENGPKGLRSWSNFAKIFVEVALTLTHFVGNAVYIVFISESITKLVAFYHPPAADWGQYFKVVLLILLILFCQIRELKHLVPFSFIANLTMVTAFGITAYYMFRELKDVQVSDRKLATGLSGIPSFFSTVVFAMEGIGTIMPVENSMTDNSFIGCPGVLNTAMTMVVTFYTMVGLCGYLAYGDKTEATITQNLPSQDVLAQTVQACISTAIFFTFMLQYYVPIDITWRRLKPHISKEKQNLAQIALRTATVTFIVGVAAAAGDRLGALIDLLGAIFFSTLGLFVPSLLDIIVNWKNWGRWNWILMKDILLLVFFLFGFVTGTYYALLNFIKD